MQSVARACVRTYSTREGEVGEWIVIEVGAIALERDATDGLGFDACDDTGARAGASKEHAPQLAEARPTFFACDKGIKGHG